jgi:hypothetical protein
MERDEDDDGWETMPKGRGRAYRIAHQQETRDRDQGAFLKARTRPQPRGRRGTGYRQAGGPAYYQPREDGYGSSAAEDWSAGGHGGRGWNRGGRGRSTGGYGGRGQGRGGSGRGRGGGDSSTRGYGGRGKGRYGSTHDLRELIGGQDQGTKQASLWPAARKNPKANIQAAAPGGSASPQDPVWAAVKALQSTMADVAKHLGIRMTEAAPATSLQETVDQGRQQPDQDQQTGRKKDTRTGQENSSSNPDFAKVCKATYRYVQTSHHTGNWDNLPLGISAALRRVTESIRPPMPTDELKNELAALAIDFGQKICQSIRTHLSTAKTRTEQELMSLDGSDARKIREVVEKQLDQRLGKKLTRERKDKLCTEAFNILGAARNTTSGADRPVQTPTGNPQAGPTTTAVKPLFSCVVAGSTDTGRDAVANDSPISPSPPAREKTVEDLPISSSPAKKMTVAAPGRKKETARRGNSQTDRGGARAQPLVKHRYQTVNRSHYKDDTDGGVFKVEDHCRVLVIGDSQVKNLILPVAFQVENFRGAHYPWITDVVPKLELPDSVEHIVLAVGFNDRDASLERIIEPTFKTCLDTLRRTTRKIHFLAIDTPEGFTAAEEYRLDSINQLALDHVGEEYYIPGHEYTVTVEKDGIHYDEETLDRISKRIRIHFSSFLN